MLNNNDESKQARIDEAASLAGPAEAFTHAFYRNVPSADVLSRSAADLAEAALSLWRFAGQRSPGQPAIEVLPGAGRGVLHVVTDDMRFLVDSVGAALSGLGLAVELIIHPVLAVQRDAGGRRVACAPDLPDGARESMMRFEVAGDLGAERHAAIVGRLRAVLADVRASVTDWPAMRESVGAVAADIEASAAPQSVTDSAEDAAFLRWLDDGNFLFLGTRAYSFQGSELAVVAGTGRGLLRDDDVLVFDGLRALTRGSPDVQAFLRGPQMTMISKSNRKSTVHRPVAMDTILVKTFDAGGQVTGLRLILGLFTTDSYFRLPHEIPVLRQKVWRCQERSGFAADSRDGKMLQHILDNFPRDELFQIDEAPLFETALGVLHLQQRPRVALFVLRDPFERFATCLVYMPRDRMNAEIRRRVASILEQAFGGSIASEATDLDQAGLARLQFVITLTPGQVDAVDVPAVERRLTEALRTWADRLHETLVRAQGEPIAAERLRRFGTAFPAAYVERFPVEAAVADMGKLDAVAAGAPIAVALAGEGRELRLKVFHPSKPVALSDVLPMLENLGLRVLNEIPFEIAPRDAGSAWIQEFQLLAAAPVDVDALRPRFEDAFRQVWADTLENDGFNRLVLTAGLSAREVVVLRTYCKVIRQAGSSFSQAYMEDTANAHPCIARLLVDLFAARADPALQTQVDGIQQQILDRLEQVENLDEDRILRSFLLLITKTLRTTYNRRDAAGQTLPYLAVKLASREIDLLPLPRPLVEIFVYSPRMEGCHLRGGKVARGGIRWSDRKEDFRTEVLGLMKAQMVKNAVIVPVGSKGGFVVKRPPSEGGREALMAEVVACYRTLMSGLLDLTDNIVGNAVVPPPDVVRHDGDDTYLVVAADKGTATFSDIANGVSAEYGFWLGDAFASGGSIGYDHKAMGITAKGAWEAVKRHFREIGTDIQTQDFTCVGVGDMAGDVFGNGMLLSRHTRLVAAFNHMHVFVDPDPDPARSWAERRRLFGLPRSSWADYDPAALSPGGGIYERRAKSVTPSPEASARLGLAPGLLSPTQLIQVLLRQPVDLLWFGGIGTYVKASAESQADAGDRANDSLRVDAAALQAKVIGEGANLAMTQRARIEYAAGGGRLNTDAIDNSAGVDTSDHEVNIKIGLGDPIAAGHMAAVDRAAFLASMTDDVEQLVLRDNILQTLAVTLAEAEAPRLLDSHVGLMRAMERQGRLDRAVELLPDDEAIVQRAAAQHGLTRPEIAVLLAYAKNGLYDELLASDLPGAPDLTAELLAYFPRRLRELAPDALKAHRLRREIVATSIANDLVNRLGPSFVEDTQLRTGRDAPAVARAYLIVRDVFGLPALWEEIEALDNRVSAATQTRLFLAVAVVVEHAMRWFLLSGLPLDPGMRIRQFAPSVQALASRLDELLPDSERTVVAGRVAAHEQAGVPPSLARRIVTLHTIGTAMDIVQVADDISAEIMAVARCYFAIGVEFGLLAVGRQARAMPARTQWQRLAADALTDDSYSQQREIVRRVMAGEALMPSQTLAEVLLEVARTSPPDLAMLTVASRRIRSSVA